MSATDKVLLQRWTTQRDAVAFHELVSRHAGMVYGTCRRILGNPADAEDVAQECFIRLASCAGFVSTSLPGWLHAVATRKCLDRIRSETRRRHREQRYATAVAPAPDAAIPALLSEVDRAIADLPRSLRDPIVLYFLEELQQEAVAERMGLSRPAVSRRIGKGIEQIRRSLKRRGVTVAIAALATSLSGLAEAAPAPLTGRLNRLALAGSPAAVPFFAGMKGLVSLVAAVACVIAAGGTVPMFRQDPPRIAVQRPEPQPMPPSASPEAAPTAGLAASSDTPVAQPTGSLAEAGQPVADAGMLQALWAKVPGVEMPAANLGVSAMDETAQMLFNNGKFDMARWVYERLIERCPDWGGRGNAFRMIGLCYDNQGKYEEAAKAYRSAIEARPDDLAFQAENYYRLAQAYRYGQKHKEAWEALDTCIDLCQQGAGFETFPGSEALKTRDYWNAEDLFRTKEYQQAIAAYREFAARYPDPRDEEDALMMIGICYLNMPEPDKAIEALETAVARHPNLFGWTEATYFYLGCAYQDVGRTDEAIYAFEHSIEMAKAKRHPANFPTPEARKAIAGLKGEGA